MSKPLKTNPAYAHIAYKKTIIHRTLIFLQRTFLADESDPKETLLCDAVFPADAEVPQEEIHYHIEALREEMAKLDVQLRKFQFVQHNDNEQAQQKGSRRNRQKHRKEIN